MLMQRGPFDLYQLRPLLYRADDLDAIVKKSPEFQMEFFLDANFF